MLVILRIYGDFDDFGQFCGAKNKPNSKPIIVSPQISLGAEDPFEKTKPICRCHKLAQTLI